MVWVSIVSGVRNEQEHLERAIRSILQQSFQDWEWIIVDDASTDGTWSLLAEWAERDSRFKIIRSETGLGLSRALNRAVNVSGGKYVARMDADDLCHPMRLAKQLRYLDEHPEVGLVGSYNHVIDGEGRVIETWRFQHTPEEIYYTLQFQNCLCHSSVMFGRDLFLELEGYREDLSVAQDYDLWLRMSHRVAIYKIPEPLVDWRKRSWGISLAKKEEQTKVVRAIALKNLKNLVGHDVPLFYLLVILGNEQRLPVGEHQAFIDLLKRIQEKILLLAPSGVNRKRLDGLCRDRLHILKMGLLWSTGKGDRFFRAFPLLLRHIRLAAPFFYYLRTKHWTLQ
jgi:glycosyltransferase involved in cell wall biosynthesis